jgi:hypothetical protein
MAGEAPAAAAKADAAAPPSTDITIDLTKPVMANGEMVKQLKFREPTGNDMTQFGDKWPVNINWTNGEVTPNPMVMANVMSVLGAVPPSTIKALKGKDFATCAHALMGFFVPGAQAMQF